MFAANCNDNKYFCSINSQLIIKLPYYSWVVAFTVVCLPSFLPAQQTASLPLKHLSIQDGLTDNNIKCMAQDGLGYLWIGTEYGLCRYDGKNMLRFFAGDKTIALPGNNVSHMKYLGNDELGISTSEGLLLLNTKTFAHQTYKVADSGAISYYQNNVWDCSLLPNNQIAISTCTGFYVFNRKGNLYFRYDRYTAADLNKRLIWGREIYQVDNNRLVIIGDGDNYAVYNYNSNKIESFKKDDGKKKEWPFLTIREIRKIKISDSEILVAHQLTDSVYYFSFKSGQGPKVKLPFPLLPNLNWNAKLLWVSDTVLVINLISGGVAFFRFNAGTASIVVTTNRSYSHLRPYCHFIDRDKRLWIGTINGLYREQMRQLAVQKVAVPHLFEQNTGASTVLTAGSKILIGCLNKRGAAFKVFNQYGDSLLKEISFFDPASDWNEIVSMAPYKGDTVLLGTGAGLLWISTSTYQYGLFNPIGEGISFFKEPFILAQPPDANGSMWLLPKHSSHAAKYNILTKKITVFDNKSKPAFPISDIKHFVKDGVGNVWIGGKGLCRYNETTNHFDTVLYAFGGRNKYSPNVTNLSADENGLLWIQTAENSLLRYDYRKKIFLELKGSSGFPEGITHAISSGGGRSIIIAQANQLIDFNWGTNHYRVINVSDGLPAEKPLSETTVYYDSLTRRYFVIYPKTVAIYSPSGNTPSGKKRLVINEIVLNNERHLFHPDSSIRVSIKENKISIHYAAPDFESGTAYIFYYKLDNSDWIYTANNSFIELGSLESGRHSLFIKSIDPEGNELLASQHIFIVPPIWKQSWFLLVSTVVVLTGIFFLYRTRLRKLKHRAEIDIRIKDLEMKALQEQMNPHFVFNALNSIKEMILTNKGDEASRYLSKFGNLLRLNLAHNSEAFITLSENNKQLQAYLEMESLRFANFSWVVSSSDDVDEETLLIPPMVMQPIVENAIWHGLLPSNAERKLSITYSLEEGELVCVTEDNGIGLGTSLKARSNEAHKSVGMDNIKMRLDLLQKKYNGRFSAEIIDKSEAGAEETGTKVTLVVPIIYHKQS